MNLSFTHLDQGYSVSIRACYWNKHQGLFECGSLAFFGSTVGAMQSIIGAQVLILSVDVLTMLARLVLATCTSQVDMVGVKTWH